MKKILCAILTVTFLFGGCARQESSLEPPTLSSTPELSKDSVSTVNDSGNNSASQESTANTNEMEPVGGDGDMCFAHNLMYHSISASLMDYVGYDLANEWEKGLSSVMGECGAKMPEDFTIVNFVNHFGIPQDTFERVVWGNLSEEFLQEHAGITVYNQEQVDAIYSGDPVLIHKVFCGPLAFVNEADGELYSIYWLAEHTAEDYVTADLPAEKIEEVLLTAASKEYATDTISKLAESAGETLTSAITLEAELAADADTEKPNSEQEDVSADDENVAE